MDERPRVSIIVRSFNEEKHLRRLLEGIQSQVVGFGIEVLLVDSGSIDNTRNIAKEFNVKIIDITPDEFTFGRSLNRGIEQAKGEYCVMVSAHCYPCTKRWLQLMVDPFEEDAQVVATYGRQLGVKSTKFSEHQIFRRWFPGDSTRDSDLPFINNANSAIRKRVWKNRKFDESLTGLEDLDWAKYIKGQGYKIAYISEASVFHVHEETPRKIYNRYYREALAYREIYPREKFNLFHFVKFSCMNIVGDLIHAIEEKVFRRNFLDIIMFRFLQFYGIYRAHKNDKPISKAMQKRLYYPVKPKVVKKMTNKAKQADVINEG